MKSKKLLAVSLCGALCLSLAGFTYASAQTADTPKTSAEETAQTSSTDILFNDVDGISTDGENWVTEADYEKNNPTPDVEWWTAEEYEKWIAEQKKELEALIQELHSIGAVHQASPAQVATAWGIAKGTLPIIGVTKVRQVEEAAAAAQLVLSDEEVSRLEKLGDESGVDTLREWEKEME